MARGSDSVFSVFSDLYGHYPPTAYADVTVVAVDESAFSAGGFEGVEIESVSLLFRYLVEIGRGRGFRCLWLYLNPSNFSDFNLQDEGDGQVPLAAGEV